MKNRICQLLSLIGLATVWGLSAAPVVSNVRATQRPGTYLVDIYYNVSSAVSPLSILVAVSADGGENYNVPAFTFSGAVGAGVTPGTDLHIVWNAGADWGGQFTATCQVRVTADDGTSPPTPGGMVYVPAGAFQMGDNFREGDSDELPVHSVWVSAFFMDKFEVSVEVWLAVHTWAKSHGYQFSEAQEFYSYPQPGHPMAFLTWHDAVKLCNARSEKEGLTPCYYTTAGQSVIYRSGVMDITNSCVKWTANGYRLPTEAEWEKAARGGLQGRRYPWGDAIDGSKSNYAQSGDPWERGSTPVGYYNGRQTPAGTDMANGYGLYDMAGNVSEYCWDWYDPVYYARAGANNDPHGPELGLKRASRGGGYNDGLVKLRCTWRHVINIDPFYTLDWTDVGFRCVRAF